MIDSLTSGTGNNNVTVSDNGKIKEASFNDTKNSSSTVYLKNGGGIEFLSLGDGDNSVYATDGSFTSLVTTGNGNNTIYNVTDFSKSDSALPGSPGNITTGSGNDTVIDSNSWHWNHTLSLSDGSNTYVINIDAPLSSHYFNNQQFFNHIITGKDDDRMIIGGSQYDEDKLKTVLTEGSHDIDLGDGNNMIYQTGGVYLVTPGNTDKGLKLGKDDDSFIMDNGLFVTSGFDFGEGNNQFVQKNGSVIIYDKKSDDGSFRGLFAGNGNDSFTYSGGKFEATHTDLGDGDNHIILTSDNPRSVSPTVKGDFSTGKGNDIFAMKNTNADSSISLGGGHNILMLDNSMLNDITTGNDNDVLTLSGVSSVRNINLGDGDNILAMSGAVIDGAVATGNGDDTLIFTRDTDADKSLSGVPSNLYTVFNNSGKDVILGDGNNTVLMNRGITFDNMNNSIVTGKGNDTFTISDGKFISGINAGEGDNTFTVTGGSLKSNITGGSGADIYYQSAGDVVGNLNAGDGDNDITLDGGTLTGDITTGAGNDLIFLSGGKHTGTVSTGKGDDILYLGMHDTSLPDIDISGLTRLDGGESSDDEAGDSLIVLRDLTGSTGSEGKAGDVHISNWENIDIGSEPVSGVNLMARAATESVKTATLSLSGDLDTRNLKINSGSVLNLSGTTESAAVKGNLINAGTIDLTRQSSPSQTLSITGNYTGSNALLKMNTVWNAPGDALGGNSQSDLLDITGTASGSTTVIPVSKDGRENVIDGDVRQVNHVINTVPVVKVRTPGEERVFTGTASTTGVSEVQLAKRTSNGVDEYFWTASAVETKDEGTQTDNGTQTDSGTQTNNGTQTDNETPVIPATPSDKGSSGPQIYNSAVAGYVSMPRVNMEQGYSTVATLHERRGENMALAWNAVTPADGQTWGRLLGEHLKQDGKTRLDVHTDTYGFQFGHDFRVTSDEDGAQHLTGGYVAYTRSDSSFYDRYRAEHGVISSDKYAGKGKSEAWSLGVTDTYYTAGGSYLDLVGQFSYLRNHYESRDNVKVSQNGWSGLLSAEAGHPFILSGTDTGPGWLLEPQAQLAYQYVSLQKFSDGVRDVDQNGQSGLRGRVGARLAWNAQKGAERGTGTFYTLANLNHDFVKPGHVDIGRDSVREKYASTWMETGVGMQLPTGPSGYLYTEARYEKELGHTQRDGWQGTFGYKYTWK
ncbi:autotransporter outer membrane beta-barrel domain-containing protein [Escherichia coli]|uniref:autotransporter outer membrane beta-barrel domain-containing protein n=3 Tax=Escherichia coli TaxID=562 RepID=UPI00320D8725